MRKLYHAKSSAPGGILSLQEQYTFAVFSPAVGGIENIAKVFEPSLRRAQARRSVHAFTPFMSVHREGFEPP